MDKDTFFNYRAKGYKLRGTTESSVYLTFIFEYDTHYYSLTEFSLLLSEYLGLDEFTFRPIELLETNKKFYEINFFKK